MAQKVNYTNKVPAVGTNPDNWTDEMRISSGDMNSLKTVINGNADELTTVGDAVSNKAPLESPAFTGTVSGISKSMVGLGNVDNTTDANKPVSTATQTALNAKAPLASPSLTGTPTAPDALDASNDGQIANTKFVTAKVNKYSRPTTPDWTAPDAANYMSPIIGGKVNMKQYKPEKVRVLLPMGKKVDLRIPSSSQAAAITDFTTTDALYSTTAVKYSGVGATTGYLENVTNATELTVPVDVTKGGFIRFWVKPIAQLATLAAFKVRLYSAGTPTAPSTDYHQMIVGTDNNVASALTQDTSSLTGVGVWQKKAIPMAMFQAVAGGANLSAIKYIQFDIVNTSTTITIEMLLGNVEYVEGRLDKARCIITFDDAHVSQYTYAATQMAKYGFKGVFFPSPLTDIGVSGIGKMTVTQLQSLQNQGHQIGTQAYNTENSTILDTYNETQRMEFHAKTRNLQNALGLYGGDFGSYFGNLDHRNLSFEPSFKKSFRALRMASTGNSAGNPLIIGETFPFGDPYYVKSLSGSPSGGASNTYARLKLHIDQAILNKGVAIIHYHDELANTGDVRTAFDTLLNYLHTKRDEIEVCTEESLTFL